MSCQECSLCGFLTPDLKSHIGHLRLVHKNDPSFHIRCGLGGCSEQFTKFSAYNTHIYRKHRSEFGLQGGSMPLTQTTDHLSDTTNMQQGDTELNIGSDSEQEVGGQGSDSEQDHMDESGIFEYSTHHNFQGMEDCHDSIESNAKLLLELSEGRKPSEVAIQDVISGCRNACTQIRSQMTDAVLQKLGEHGVDSAVIDDVMEAMSDSYQDPFMKLSSPYLREKYYKEHFPYLVRSLMTFNHIYH